MKRNSFTRVSVLLFIVLLCHSALLAEDIPLSQKGGVYELPVEINGVLTLNFVLDSGASEVLIPADVVLTLIRTGTIKDTDFLTGQTHVLVDGSTVQSPRFILRSLKIGSRQIDNVHASIGNLTSGLLLGQQSVGTYPSQPQVARLEPESTLRERESVAVPAATISGESRNVGSWSRKTPFFHMDLKPVSNREFLDFVKADPQWKKSQIASTLHDGDYLKHWEGDEAVRPSELDEPVRYVSFYAASAFCSVTGEKIPRLNSYRAAANISSSESLTLSYETSYKAPDFNFVHTE